MPKNDTQNNKDRGTIAIGIPMKRFRDISRREWRYSWQKHGHVSYIVLQSDGLSEGTMCSWIEFLGLGFRV